MKPLILISLLLAGCATNIPKFEQDADGMGIHRTGEYLSVKEAKQSGYVRYRGKWILKENLLSMREDLQWINDQETIESNALVEEESKKLNAVYPYYIFDTPTGTPPITKAQRNEHQRIEDEYKLKHKQVDAKYDELRKWTVERGNSQLK